MKKILLSLVLGTSLAGFSQVIYDQTANQGTSGIVSCYYNDIDTAIVSADDFTIGVGDTWEVSGVTVTGFRSGTGVDMDSMKVEIFNDNAGAPGTAMASELFYVTIPGPQSDTTLSFTFSSAVTLTGGTYWLSVTGYAPSDSRWNWYGVTSVHGAEAMLFDEDDFFGAGATSWTNFTGLGLTFSQLQFSITGEAFFAGIEDEVNSDLAIYPNPVLDVLNITNVESNEIKSISIYNMAGQLQEVLPASNQLNVAHLATGSYLVEVSTIEGATIRRRFMKQ